MTVNFLIKWAKKWRKIAASTPSNDVIFERAIKNLRWINDELKQIYSIVVKNKYPYFK